MPERNNGQVFRDLLHQDLYYYVELSSVHMPGDCLGAQLLVTPTLILVVYLESAFEKTALDGHPYIQIICLPRMNK